MLMYLCIDKNPRNGGQIFPFSNPHRFFWRQFKWFFEVSMTSFFLSYCSPESNSTSKQIVILNKKMFFIPAAAFLRDCIDFFLLESNHRTANMGCFLSARPTFPLQFLPINLKKQPHFTFPIFLCFYYRSPMFSDVGSNVWGYNSPPGLY